ncbi:unnamed protein product [Prunus armeniaca]|uniref:Uncharacterized protein n=1 Tax=Prunus armeniaca TaxID=36596 RepID=A0A6J5TMB1_PRUAR|nr:unnamed protein product [Prunus armeniaca]
MMVVKLKNHLFLRQRGFLRILYKYNLIYAGRKLGNQLLPRRATCKFQISFELLREFEEARQELQRELEKGASLDEIRKKSTKGEIQTKVTKKFESKQVFRTDRIQRKKRDFMQIINKHAAKIVDEAKIVDKEHSVKPKTLTAVELFAKAKEEQDGGSVLRKYTFGLNDKDLLVVRDLVKTLVGAYPGRALSFISKKNDLDSPQVLGYPSKPVGLFIRRSIIFRSDSNGEDLEGYAGAGLYDSVPMDEEEKVVLDYSSDPLMVDGNFRKSILSSIARAGSAIEELYGSPQDIEGVIRDGKLYVVQTRPQM